jgi:hypothetical protein
MIYIRDFKNNQWRCYNDEKVTNVSEEEVFQKRPFNQWHAPLLAYVRDDLKDELIDPVYRRKLENADGDGDHMMGEPPVTFGVTLHHSDVWGDAGMEYDGPMKSLLD